VRDAARSRSPAGSVFLYAFDLIELNGNDLRRDPLEVRKATLLSSCPSRRKNLGLLKHGLRCLLLLVGRVALLA
jgi:ATP-dependent DNA ligase